MQTTFLSDGAPGDPEDKGDDQKTTQQAKEELLTMEQVQEQIDAATQELRVESEKDINNVRSDLMRAHNEREKAWDEQDKKYQATILELQTKDMDEADRAVFEAKHYVQRNVELQERLDQTQTDLEQSRNMGAYISGMAQAFGVDIKELDLSDPEKLSQTAFDAAADNYKEQGERVQELETLLDKAKGQGDSEGDDAEPKPKVKDPPKVVTETGGTASGEPTLIDIRKSVSKNMGLPEGQLITEEELFDLAENPDETGVDLNMVLPAIQAELEALAKKEE